MRKRERDTSGIARDVGRRAREEEGGAFVFFEPGENPPDPPLRAWLAGSGEAQGQSREKPGSGIDVIDFIAFRDCKKRRACPLQLIELVEQVSSNTTFEYRGF